jgi:hypothetical protein
VTDLVGAEEGRRLTLRRWVLAQNGVAPGAPHDLAAKPWPSIVRSVRRAHA